MSFVTTLTPWEVGLAQRLAEARNDFSVALGDAPAHGAPTNGDDADTLTPNVIGARGELAVAKLLGIYPNVSTYHEEKASGGFDLAYRVMVRAAQKRFGLLVRPGDPPEGRYVAVVVRDATVTVLGWEYGLRARREEWLQSPHGRPPCYLVPERHLQPLSSLLALIAVDHFASVVSLDRRENGAPLAAVTS